MRWATGFTGEISIRANNEGVAADYERLHGLRPGPVAEDLSSRIVGAPVTAAFDGLSSATITTRRLAQLRAEVEQGRVAVDLPNRVCDR